MQTLADILHEYKKQNDIKSSAALARQIGVSVSGLHRIMSNKVGIRRRPSVETIRMIADATGIDERTIIDGAISSN